MKRETFYNFLPIGLMMIGFGLWAKTLVFDSPTNKQEAKLYSIWEKSLENSNRVLVNNNHKIRMSMEETVRKQPYDLFLLKAADSVLLFQNKALAAINNTENIEDSTYVKILKTFNNEVKPIIKSIHKKRPRIGEEYIKQILDMSFQTNRFDIGKNNPNAFKSYINVYSNVVLSFLAQNLSFRCFCFDRIVPELVFTPTLKLGETSEGEIYVTHLPCDGYDFEIPERLKVNDKWYPIEDGEAKVTTVFINEQPKSFSVKGDFIYRKINAMQVDTTINSIQKDFIIHPFYQ